LLLSACAAVTPAPQAASQPASRPSVLYVPVDPKDPTKGYTVSYEASGVILADSLRDTMACNDAKIDLTEQAQLCQAQLSSQTPSVWRMYVLPVLIGLGAAAVGGGVGYIAGENHANASKR
jgi:hypothetical protein